MAICVVMWWLNAYPKTPPPAAALALRTQAAVVGLPPANVDALTTEAGVVEARAQQAGSFAGHIGRGMQPAFAPLGFDWQLTVGIVTSFIAREVFVSTMSVLAGGGGGLDRIRVMTRDDGTLVFTRATAASALVFFVLAMQCLPTLAVTRRETGKLRYALLQLGYMSTVAYIAAFIVYQGMRAAGVQ
jgi:ferrous iron transport protein B